MLNINEIRTIVIVTLILGFTLSLIQTFELFLWAMLSVFVILLINIIAKKVAAYYFESEVEIKLWEIKRYGFKSHYHLKHAFPAGLFFPIITTALSFGYFNWMASTIFDVKAKVYRAAKRHGLYRFSEMTEWHIGLIAAAGILANLGFAVIGYLINLPPEMKFHQFSTWFAFFNLIPIGNLDGNKIFFGNFVIWSFLAAVTLIGLIGLIFVT
ncbi:MAG: hypothetical protein ACE5ES_01245 [Candidatus Nanoarchaeia archaeon]